MSLFIQQLKAEFAAIFRNPAVALTIIGGVLLYSVLYPQPYLKQLPREENVAVIDVDNSSTSRRLLRWMDATPEVKISHHVVSIDAAKQLLIKGEVHGFVHIPANFERDLVLSKSPVVSIAGDANYFLIYGTIIEGLAIPVATLGAEFRVKALALAGSPIQFATQDWSPVRLNQRPLFNTSMGYLGYVIPAVFILILQQTLLLASALIGTTAQQTLHSDEADKHKVLTVLCARFCAMFITYIFLAQFYMGACFHWYGISRLANLTDLWLMIIAFTASSTLLGIVIGLLIPRKELAAPLVMVSSLPLVFTAGFVWPLESIPAPLLWLSQLVPSTAAIQGFLKLNQMGASFDSVLNHWYGLFILSVFYAFFAYYLLKARYKDTTKVYHNHR